MRAALGEPASRDGIVSTIWRTWLRMLSTESSDRICCSDMALPPIQIQSRGPSRLHAESIGWPARVSPTFEHTALLVGDNRTHRSGKPCPLRPPFNLVAEAGERFSGETVYATFQIEPPGVIGMRLEG